MLEKLEGLLKLGFSHIDAKDLIMAEIKDEKKQSVGHPSPAASAQPVTSSTPARVAASRVANASNVIVKKQKLFLTKDESAATVDRIDIEVVLQKSKLIVRKKGINRGEAEASNDVFTLLEHPSVKSTKVETLGDNVTKKETMFEAHVRA